jgi:acyl-CoA dehydrogenase
MRRVLNDAMDIHGGRGICAGPSNYLLPGYQAVPVGITVEGANILTRSLIVFGQGAVRCHPWLLKELEATRTADAQTALTDFDAALRGHLGHFIGNFGRALIHNLTLGFLIRIPVTGATRRWYRELTLASINFALLSDIALITLGGQLKRREKLSGRFADVLAELYMMSASLKRFEDDGRPREDLPVIHFVCLNGLHVVQQRFAAILQNFPLRWLRWPIRRLILPWGTYRKAAGDRLGRAVARLLTRPGDARERLTEGVYVNTSDHDDPTGRIEHAFELAFQAAPVERKMRKAVREGHLGAIEGEAAIQQAVDAGIISPAEASILTAAASATRKAIMVDDFPFRQSADTAKAVEASDSAAAA